MSNSNNNWMNEEPVTVVRGGKVYSKFKNGTEILIRNNSKPSPTKNKPRNTIKINRNIPIKKQNALKLLNSRKNNLSVKEYNNLKNQLNSKINLKPAVLAGVPRIKFYKYNLFFSTRSPSIILFLLPPGIVLS
jgi:hypothetical protein